MRSILAACLVLGVIAGGTESPEDLNTRAFRKLWKATQERDASAYPLVHKVLLDMAEQSYAYLKDVRLTAFDYIQATGDPRALSLLEKIAEIEYIDDDSGETTLDLIAIRGALDAVVKFGSENAAELNRRHLAGNAWVQTTAIANLKGLGSWEATPAVEQDLCSKPRVGDNYLVFLSAAEFLQASPESSVGICPCIEEVETAYHQEIQTPIEESAATFFKQLGKALNALEDRLACPR